MDAKADFQELSTLTNLLAMHKRQSDVLRPFITLSFGMSLDGKIATRTGDSKYISSVSTRQFVHALRHIHDGILVGIRTVQLDHPSLTTRLQDGRGKDAHRIILDSHLAIDLAEPLLQLPSNAKTYVVTKAGNDVKKMNTLMAMGVVLLIDPTNDSTINLNWLMLTLKKHRIDSLLVEGGGTIHESFIRSAFFDRIYAQVSPLLIGGKDAKTPVEGLGFATLKEASHIAFCNHFPIDRDIILVAQPIAKEKP